MTEFTKTKIHFALALLGTLFVFHPFVEKYSNAGFIYLGYPLTIMLVYLLLGGFIAFTVYCYAMALMSDRTRSWAERTGNYAYAIALMIPPLYGGLFLATLLAEEVGEYWAWAAPTVALSLGVAGLIGFQILALVFRKRLGDQDQTARINQLAEQEIEAVSRARDLFNHDHYDLSVIEAWKAIEARLRRVLLKRGLSKKLDDPQTMIKAAAKASILPESAQKLLPELRKQWNIAVSTEPLTKEAAITALQAARNILASIPVEDAGDRAEHLI